MYDYTIILLYMQAQCVRTSVRTRMYVRACECRPMCVRVCVHECGGAHVRVCVCIIICMCVRVRLRQWGCVCEGM